MNMPAPNHSPQTSVVAVASLVCGLLCWCILPFVGALAAVICGHMARVEIRRAPAGTLGGDGAAIAGLILGWAHLALIFLVILAMFGLLGSMFVWSPFQH